MGEWGGCRVKWGKELCVCTQVGTKEESGRAWLNMARRLSPKISPKRFPSHRFLSCWARLISWFESVKGELNSIDNVIDYLNIQSGKYYTCKFGKQDKSWIVSRVLWSISEVCKIWKRERKCWGRLSRVKVFLQGSPVFSYLPNIYLDIHSSGPFCSSYYFILVFLTAQESVV